MDLGKNQPSRMDSVTDEPCTRSRQPENMRLPVERLIPAQQSEALDLAQPPVGSRVANRTIVATKEVLRHLLRRHDSVPPDPLKDLDVTTRDRYTRTP